MSDIVNTPSVNTREQHPVREYIVLEQSSPYCLEKEPPFNDGYGLELLRRAITQDDQMIWTEFQQCFSDVVRGWLRCHPSREAACALESEEQYITLAFERFRQATVHHQLEFRTLSEALRYLYANLNGAILDTLRASSRPREVPKPFPGNLGEPRVEDQADPDALWETVQSMLPSVREQRLAYLFFHCGLKPREIVQICPIEFASLEEVYRLRRNIVAQLLHTSVGKIEKSFISGE